MDRLSLFRVGSPFLGAASLLLTVLIFLFDLSTPHGRAEWLLYLLPLLLSTYAFKRRGVYLLAMAQSVMVVSGYVFSVGSVPSSIILFNRALVVMTIWMVAYFSTSRQIAQTRLQKAKDELELRVEARTAELTAANRSLTEEVDRRKVLEREKADFLAMVSHDMKSPLSVMYGYADLLKNTKYESLDPDVRSMVDAICNSNEKLLRLVEDFVAVTKIEAGKLQPQPYPQQVGTVLKGISVQFGVVADSKGVTFKAELPEGPVKAELDWNLVQRAVSNLLENAMNYTQEGGEVVLSAYTDDTGLVIEVRDNGPGIPPEEQERVFEKYYRSKRTAATKGTGLGLAIVKAVTEAHGGRVELESEPGRGSTFRMVFPECRITNSP